MQCSHHFSENIIQNRQQVIEEILIFIANRIKTIFQEYGFSNDEIEACLSQGFDDIYDSYCRVQALHDFRQKSNPQFISLYEVYKRAKGQLNGEQRTSISEEHLVEPAEKYLNLLLNQQYPEFKGALSQRNYSKAYALIATIQPALANLFNEVKILADDPQLKENRLALLRKVFNLFDEILDFSKIQEKP